MLDELILPENWNMPKLCVINASSGAMPGLCAYGACKF